MKAAEAFLINKVFNFPDSECDVMSVI